MFRKLLKIIGIIFLLLFTALVILFYRFSTPKSDEKIRNDFSESNSQVYISKNTFKEFEYRVLTTQKKIDTTLPTIVFIHGSIGSALDFKHYLLDSTLNEKANLISYDRVGYGLKHTGDVQESIAFETKMLEDLINNINKKNTILVGYSYGGPIALASNNEYKKIILLAPEVYSEVEPMPWVLNFYKWKATRWLLPKIWKAASKEKLTHKSDLLKFETSWNENPSTIISIHGNKDWIVPFKNSLYLKEILPPKQYDLVTLNKAGHGLVWSHFEEIKSVLVQQLNE
ncbi:MAG: alpha/beta fold hydrolase [Lutibacter sp.]|uniref:alpha/beta fold hydrolase n=1 Tax=Lutibacter sp. TaxID=1925666 RepID=UPI0019EEFA17|nr:alpha/beta hydrolase [Lutibacter sp.]NOR28371.1 alpha/beta fold hydrolase [Lutibacter sp.]